jgi:hypothetical protein
MGKSVPTINQWYQDLNKKRLFEVIAVDEYSALIDIRYADPAYENGAYSDVDDENSGLDIISFDGWSKMIVVPARAPADWRSAIGLGADSRMVGTHGDGIVMPNPDSASMDSIKAADYLFGWDEF